MALKTTKTDEGVVVAFGNTMRTGPKLLLYAEAGCALAGVLIFLYLAAAALSEPGLQMPVVLLSMGGSAIMALGAYYFFKRIYSTEEILIRPDKICITETRLFKKHTQEFLLTEIKDLRYIGRQHYVDHPLKGQSFDYLGFQTQQEVINTVHDEGNMSFSYAGRTVYFGKEVYSWQAEELEEVLKEVTGGRLRFANLDEYREAGPQGEADGMAPEV